MMELQTLYTFLDLSGTFAFAISGAVAARQKGLDLFGIIALAFTVACGGGIIRDVCLGAVPPAGLTDWRYLFSSIVAAFMTVATYALVKRLHRPVLLFDALGLSLFAVTGAQKALAYGCQAEVAILLGITTAVGGGVLRDVLLNRVPLILEKEIYASAALTGALFVVLGDFFGWAGSWVSLVGIFLCFGLRLLSVYFHWNLPVFHDKKI